MKSLWRSATAVQEVSPRAQAVLSFIDTNPGCDAVAVGRALDIPSSHASALLHQYHKRGRIKRRLLDGRLRYYADNYRLPAEEKPDPNGSVAVRKRSNNRRPRGQTQRKILAYIKTHPGVQNRDLRQEFGINAASIAYHTRLLKDKGAILTEGYRLYPQPPIQTTVTAQPPTSPSSRPLTHQGIEALAKEYFWERGSHREALREFVAWVEEREKRS